MFDSKCLTKEKS